MAEAVGNLLFIGLSSCLRQVPFPACSYIVSEFISSWSRVRSKRALIAASGKQYLLGRFDF